MSSHISNVRPKPDKVLTLIADYATKYQVTSAEAYDTARYCLMDTLGCGLEALEYPACTKLLGPIDPETVTPHGAKVPGTLAPCGTTVSGSIGPSSLVHAGYSSASRPQPSVSMRQ